MSNRSLIFDSPFLLGFDHTRALIDLLKALVATKHEGIGERTIRERVEMRMEEYAPFMKASKKHFK